jgi:fibronectin-binding autotransporter adhesin
MKTNAVSFKQIVLLAALSTLTLPALADQTWTGAANNQWNSAANWNGTALPGASDAVIYNNLSLLNLGGVLGEDFAIQGILVSNAPAAVAIGGANTLTLTPTTLTYTNLVGSTANRMPLGIGMANATQNLGITVPVALGSTQAWVVANGQTLDVSGAVSVSAGLYKDGLGTLYLEGANTFAGGFTDNGGAVWINNSAALGGGGTTRNYWFANNALGAGLHLNGTNGNISLPGAVQFNLSQQYGAIFNEAGDNVITGNMYVQSGGGLVYIVANAGSLTLNGLIGLSVSARPFQVGGAAKGIINGQITQSLPFTKTDSGTWTLNHNNNTYSGVTTVQGGTLALGATAKIPNTPSILILSNATLDVSAMTNNVLSTNALYLTPSSTVQALGGNGTVNGNVFCPTTAYIVPGGTNAAGTLTITSNLTLNGGVTLPFELNTATNAGSGVNDLLNVNGQLDPEYAMFVITPLSLLPNGATYRLVNYGSETVNSFNSYVATDSRCTFNLMDIGGSPGHVDVQITGGNSNLVWSGGSGASWDLNSSANWDANALTFYNSDAVTFDDSGSPNNNVTINGTVRPVSVSVANTNLNYAFLAGSSSKITGNTGITKSGPGYLTNLVSCDFTGPVTVNGGTYTVYTVANGGSASPLGAGNNITLNGGTFLFGGKLPGSGSFNRSWTLGANGGTVMSATNAFYLAGQISGPGSFTKSGSQQIILGDVVSGSLSTGASNIFSGNTLVTQGELQIRNNNALGYGKAVVTSGADLAVGGGVAYGSLGTITNNIDLNGDGPSSNGALQVNDNNTTANFSGTINLVTSSSVGVVAGSPLTFIISGPITGSGMLKKQNHLAGSTVILTCPSNSYSGGTLVVGGTLQLGNGGSCGSLGSGSVTDNGTLAYNHSDSIINNSAISGTGNLTHTGTGTLTLGGANTYSGTTVINGGTLVVNGSLGTGAVTINSGATLGGNGTIGGAVTLSSGSTLSLGANISTLNINNLLNLGGTTIMKVSHVAGAANDSIAGVSTLTFAGALNVTATGTLQANDSFKLFNATTYFGSFSSTNLPALGPGLSWDTSALGTGTLRVSGTAADITAYKVLNNGNFQLTFTGPNGAGYRVWASTNAALKPVTSTWTPLFTNTFGTSPVTFTDTQASSFPRRFYVISTP